jgi:hypothetical protein
MTEVTLEDFLEFNCHYVESAVRDLSSGHDLEPLLSYVKQDGDVVMVPLGAGWANSLTKDLTMAWCRTRLRADQAQIYALISAAWTVRRDDPAEAAEVERVIIEEGSSARYSDERKECYVVSVGNREGSMVATLWVVRDYKQKIRGITRGPVSKGDAEARGRMVHLLREIE